MSVGFKVRLAGRMALFGVLLTAATAATFARAAPARPGCATPGEMPRDSQPAFSPGGSKVAFVRRYSFFGPGVIVVADANGSHERQLTGTGLVGDPTWSPDGQTIAYSDSSSQGHARLIAVRADGSGTATTVVESPGTLASPAYSPDGRSIAFLLDLPGDGETAGPYLADIDGSRFRPISVSGLTDVAGIAWSPDGKQLAVGAVPDGDPVGHSNIFVFPPTGGSARKIPNGFAAIDPAWSPDGRWIAYAEDDFTVFGAHGTSVIKVVRPDGSGLHSVTPPVSSFAWSTRQPTWKDARTVGYSAWRPATHNTAVRNVELHTIGIDGRGERRLTYHCQFGSARPDPRLRGTYLDDIIIARDGQPDVIECGRGRDLVYVDRKDRLRSCEIIRLGRR
jgi:Tol biopolymer transport system component